MQYSVLIDKEDYPKAEEEEKYRFLHSVLSQLVPLDTVWPDEDHILSPQEKIKLFKFIFKFKLIIIENIDRTLQLIHREEGLLAEWRKCRYEVVKDMSEIDPKRRLYYRLNIDCWSIFDDADDDDDDSYDEDLDENLEE